MISTNLRDKTRIIKKRPPRLERMKRGIFILPVMITLCNFGLGFISILYSIEDKFITASYMIIFAMVADMLDGAIARITRTESKFGGELDSLADIVSFGCAPAILIFKRFGLAAHPYWIFPLFFAIAGALRLARYNVVDSNTGAKDFCGTPIPAPAGIVVGLVLALERHRMTPDKIFVILLVITLSYLMLCNIRYPSSKVLLKPERPHSFGTLLMLLIIVGLLFYHFVGAWLTLGACYYLSGPYLGIRSLIAGRPKDEELEGSTD